jgi:hypothetical protein
VQQEEEETEVERRRRLLLFRMATFRQDVRDLTGLNACEMQDIIEQGGIESAEDLAMFGDKDIDTLFQQTPHLKETPLLKQIKLKGLAEWLRDQHDERNGFPLHEATPADINEKLLTGRARR